MKLLILITFIYISSPHILSAHELNLQENSALVKAGDKFVTLLGDQIQVGQTAPNFKLVNSSFSPITLDDFSGKNILISVVPSLDTGVCSIQTKNFNDKAAALSENTIFLTISNDLPFAQKRFCNIEKINDMTVLSDAVWHDFGAKYGLVIKDMGLLTRAIIIIDPNKKITYKELVSNISNQPNYEKALEQIRMLNKQK